MFTQNYHNTVNWLYSIQTQNKNAFKKVLEKCFTNLQIQNCTTLPKKPDYFYKHIEGTKEHVRNHKRKFKKNKEERQEFNKAFEQLASTKQSNRKGAEKSHTSVI